MKVKNLFSCVALLGAMALSSCGQQPHSHNPGEHGFCSCGIYMGETFEFAPVHDSGDEWLYDFVNVFLGTISDNYSYHFRVEGGKNYHAYHFEQGDGVVVNNVTAFTVNEAGQIVNYMIDDVFGVQSLELGPDRYLYFDVNVPTGSSGAWLQIQGFHYFAAAGVCEHDGQFVTNQGKKHGHVIPMGTATAEFINIASADGGADYYQFSEDTNTHNPCFGGHTVKLTNIQNIPANSLSMYYVDLDNKTHEIHEGDMIPVGISHAYVKLAHDDAISNGRFTIATDQHPLAEHGYCPYCDHLMNGTLPLGMNEGFSDPFDISVQEMYYFAVDVTHPETNEFTIRFDSSTKVLEDSGENYDLYIWNGENFETVESESTGLNEVTYDITNVDHRTDYVFFQVRGTGAHSNVRVRAVDLG